MNERNMEESKCKTCFSEQFGVEMMHKNEGGCELECKSEIDGCMYDEVNAEDMVDCINEALLAAADDSMCKMCLDKEMQVVENECLQEMSTCAEKGYDPLSFDSWACMMRAAAANDNRRCG